MLHSLQKNFSSALLGFMFGATLFVVLFGNISSQNALANITIPYEKEDSGLTVEVVDDKYREIITQKEGEDAGAIVIGSILTKIFLGLKILLGSLVVFWIVFAGVYIIAGATDEEQVKTGKQMLKYSLFGLVFMLLIEPVVLDIFYGGGDIHTDQTGIGDIATSTENLRSQVDGIIGFVKTLLIFIAMGYIIKAGSQMIFAHGDEEKVSSAKNIFIPMFVGFLIVMFNEVFIDQVLYNTDFIQGNSHDILNQGRAQINSADASGSVQFVKEIVGFLKYLLGVIAVILLGFIIYGGFVVMTAMGEDEKIESGKKIIMNAVIGMIIIVSSFVLMASLVNFEV